MANPEGPVTPLVTDVMKFQCTNCNGSKFYISTTMDDPNDVAGDTVFAALGLTAAGGHFHGLVVSCVQCGVEQVPYWIIYITGTFDGTTGLTNVHLDATAANGLADHFVGILIGTDVRKYVEIATNSAAAPTVIATKFNVNNDADGICFITNIAPVGFTKIVA